MGSDILDALMLAILVIGGVLSWKLLSERPTGE